jgi:hypothetical protein
MAVLGATTLTGCNSIPDFIGTGSIWVFHQTSAPTSWTKITTLDNRALRVTNGSVTDGGNNPFTATFAGRSFTINNGAHTLSWPEMASHAHPLGHSTIQQSDPAAFPASARGQVSTDNRGGNASHTHPAVGSGTVDLSVKYIDVIFASKN